MRFFTIGIGNGISPYLIQGVAKAGNGDYDFVKDEENIEQKTQYLISSQSLLSWKTSKSLSTNLP